MGLDSPTTLIIIFVAVLLLFGGKKIPELMKGLGSGVREFKNAQSGERNNSSDTEPTDQTKVLTRQFSYIRPVDQNKSVVDE